jgi:UcrQ family
MSAGRPNEALYKWWTKAHNPINKVNGQVMHSLSPFELRVMQPAIKKALPNAMKRVTRYGAVVAIPLALFAVWVKGTIALDEKMLRDERF